MKKRLNAQTRRVDNKGIWMAKTKICLVGAAGRMGLEFVRAASASKVAEVVSAIDTALSPSIGKDVGELVGIGPQGAIINTDLATGASACDVIVDLSLPIATQSVIAAAKTAKKPIVCGTTGLTSAVLLLFDEAAKEIPVIQVTNFSQGVAVLSILVEQAARLLGESFDIEVVEMHHRNKVDAPSGTALTLAASAAAGRNIDADGAIRNGREGHTGIRSATEIGMHALRGGGVFGDHTVIFASPAERVELVHKAESRAMFAEGAVKAAVFLAVQKPGRYTMRNVLGL
jgi:4-hydroxy-tetrahydrodipicolinate reductase